MPRGTNRKKAPVAAPGSKLDAEKDVLITRLRNELAKSQEFNKALSRENTELSRNINELLAKLDAVGVENVPPEMATLKPDDLVKVIVKRPKFSITYTDYQGITRVYTTGDTFEMRRSQLAQQSVGAIVLFEG